MKKKKPCFSTISTLKAQVMFFSTSLLYSKTSTTQNLCGQLVLDACWSHEIRQIKNLILASCACRVLSNHVWWLQVKEPISHMYTLLYHEAEANYCPPLSVSQDD